MARQYGKNIDGVHLMHGEYSLCGDAFDIHAVDETVDEIKPVKRGPVTCVKCKMLIELCRGVRTA